MTQKTDIVIIGAGLTGLTLAHKLVQRGRDILVLERKSRLGGVINTESAEGFVFEEGPNTGLLKFGEVAELFQELSGGCELEIPDDSAKKRYVWKGGRWHRLPSGLIGGVRTSLFSWKDKFRLLGEPFRPAGTDPEETLDRMVRRRMGESFLHYAVDPFILGVYAGDPARIVPKYALPKLYYLEQDYGSFIGGAVRKGFEKKGELEKKATRDLFSVKGGLGNMIRALTGSVGRENILLGTERIAVKPLERGFETSCSISGETRRISSRLVVSTIGSHQISEVFPFIQRDLRNAMESLRYAKVVQAAVGFHRWEGIPLEGFGGLVPHIEKRDILGAMFMSSFLEGRAPEKGALLSVFMGGTRREDMFHKEDSEIESILAEELTSMLGIEDFNPDLLRIMRYEHAIPQYGVGSGERLGSIEEVEKRYPGLIIIGNMRDGIGMADRIKQAWDISGKINWIWRKIR